MYTVRRGGPELIFFFGPVALWERRRHQYQWPHAKPTVEECFRPTMVPQGRPSPRAWAGRTRLWVDLGVPLAAVSFAEKTMSSEKKFAPADGWRIRFCWRSPAQVVYATPNFGLFPGKLFFCLCRPGLLGAVGGERRFGEGELGLRLGKTAGA